MNDLDQFKKNAGLSEAGYSDQVARAEKVRAADFEEAERLIFLCGLSKDTLMSDSFQNYAEQIETQYKRMSNISILIYSNK